MELLIKSSRLALVEHTLRFSTPGAGCGEIFFNGLSLNPDVYSGGSSDSRGLFFFSVLVLSFIDFFFGAGSPTNSHSSFREGFVSGTQPAGLLCTASQTDYCKVVSPRLITTSSLVGALMGLLTDCHTQLVPQHGFVHQAATALLPSTPVSRRLRHPQSLSSPPAEPYRDSL